MNFGMNQSKRWENSPIILSSNKIQNEDILVPANPSPSGKMAVKTDRDNSDNLSRTTKR